MVQEAVQEPQDEKIRCIVSCLTVEQASYGLAVLIALGLRLWDLDASTLGPAEALQALPAVAALNGAATDLVGSSPLLHVLQRITFALFGASDSTARFWPALLGGLSPALFFTFRRHLTPGGALAGAFLWSLSPLGVWSSRLALGDALVPVMALAMFAVLAEMGRGRKAGAWFGLTTGLLLISGPNAYTVLLGLVAAALWPGSEVRGIWSGIRDQARLAFGGLLIALVIATLFLTEPAGLAGGVGLFSTWLSDLVPGRGEYSVAEIILRLVISEPLVLTFGIASAISLLRHSNRPAIWLSTTTTLALLVALAGRGRHPVDLSLVALGLALLAGPVVDRVLGYAHEWRRERDPWLLVLVSLAMLAASAISLPSALNAANAGGWRSLYAGVGTATLIMSVIIWIAYGVWDNWRTVARALPIVPLVLGLAWQIGSMVSLSYDRGAGHQSGIVHEMPDADLIDLQKELRNLSALNGGGEREAEVDVVWPSLATDPVMPVLQWQLRAFPNVRFNASIPPDVAPLVMTRVEEQPRLNSYSGAEFAVLQRWTIAQLPDSSSALRWVLFREALTAPEKTRLILWAHAERRYQVCRDS